jgi:hypothetical protein
MKINLDLKFHFSVDTNKNKMISFNESTGAIRKQFINDNVTLHEEIFIEEYLEDLKVKIINQNYILTKQSFNLKNQPMWEDNGKWYRVVLLDFNTAFEYSNHQNDIFKFLKAPTSNEMNPNSDSGEYEVCRTNDEISSFWMASAKGLEKPEVYDGDRIVKDIELYNEFCSENNFLGICYVGDKGGSAHSVKLYLDEENIFRKEVTKIFDYSNIKKQNNNNTLANAEKNKNVLKAYNDTNYNNQNNMMMGRPARLDIFECKRFIKESLDVLILKEDPENNMPSYTLFVKEVEDNTWISFELHTFSSLYPIILKPLKNSKTSITQKFYLENNNKIRILSYNKQNRYITQIKIKEFDDLLFKYSFKQDFFYIRNNNSVEIYDSNLEQLITVLKYESQIEKIEVSKNKLLIYELKKYHELDLDSLKPMYQRAIDNSRNHYQCEGFFNVDSITPNTEFVVLNFKGSSDMNMEFFSCEDVLQIANFPMNNLMKCLSPLHYQKHLKTFSEYYFTKIEESDFNDDIFEFLNPLLICIYHKNPKLLQELLTTYRYPKSIKGGFTPLSYAFENNSILIIKILCQNLFQYEEQVELTHTDFEYLLESSYPYCHKLLAKIPKETELDLFPSFIEMNYKVKLFNANNLTEAYNQCKLLDSSLNKNNFMSKKQNENDSNKKDVITYKIPFKYSFESGSPGSVMFLNNYSDSNNEEFLLSQWKNLVILKWKNQLFLQVMIAVLYWTFTGFVIASMIFVRDTAIIKYASLGLMVILFFFELLQFIAYCTYNIKM